MHAVLDLKWIEMKWWKRQLLTPDMENTINGNSNLESMISKKEFFSNMYWD